MDKLTKYILMNMLELLEDYELENSSDNPEVCCGDFKNCSDACVVRADYWKNNSRVELNKLALSILKKSLEDENYRQSWIANISMAIYDTHMSSNTDIDKQMRIDAANCFIDRLFGGIE